MPRSREGVRQLPSKKCGCERCKEKYPAPQRRSTQRCTANWQYRFYDDAGNRQSGTRRTQDEAVDAMNKAKGEIVSGTWNDPKRGKLALNAWRAEYAQTRTSLEAATRARDESHWNAHVGPRWGRKTLRTIEHSHKDIQQWVAELERTHASASVSSILNCLDQLMEFAKRDKRIRENPCDGIKVKPPVKKHATQDRPPTIEQTQACATAIAIERYRQLPLLVLETGLRWGEAAGLPPEAVDIEEGLVDVWQVLEEVGGRKVLRKYPKSDASFRTVPLTLAGRALIRMQYEIDDPIDGEPIFRGPNGGYLSRNSYRTRYWLPATIAAGVHRESERASGQKEHWPTIHDIRATWASRLESGGVPESTRKELLGHERPGNDVTWRYTHGAADIRDMVLRALGDEPEGEVKPVVRRLKLAS